MEPTQGGVAVGLALAVGEAAGVVESVLPVVDVGVLGNLVIVAAHLSDEAKLVGRVTVVEEGGETADSVLRVVDGLRDRRLQAEVAAVAAEAGIPGEFLAVVAEADLVVGLVEVSGGKHKFAFAAAFEAGARQHVEHAVGAVAQVGAVAAAFHFERVDVFGVDLRADVAGDVGVGDLDAVNEPAQLMASAHVQHVMGHVGAGDVVGDHGHGVGEVGAGGLGDVDAVDQGGGSDCVDVGCLDRRSDGDALGDGAKLKHEVEDGRSVGMDGEGLLEGCEAGVGDGDGVVAERDVGEGEGAFFAGDDGEGEVGVGGSEGDVGAGKRAMLRVVDDALQLGEDGGAGARCREQAEEQEEPEQCEVFPSEGMHRGLRSHEVVTRLGRVAPGRRLPSFTCLLSWA